MADALHKLNRTQLLDLLYSQSKELEEQQQRAEKAEARVKELSEKLEEINTSAVAIFQVLEKTRQVQKEAKAEARSIVENAKAEAERIVDEARQRVGRTPRQFTFKPRGQEEREHEEKQPTTSADADIGGAESGT